MLICGILMDLVQNIVEEQIYKSNLRWRNLSYSKRSLLTILISEETCIIFSIAKWFEIQPDVLRLKQIDEPLFLFDRR